jgi:hypothetical protein
VIYVRPPEPMRRGRAERPTAPPAPAQRAVNPDMNRKQMFENFIENLKNYWTYFISSK